MQAAGRRPSRLAGQVRCRLRRSFDCWSANERLRSACPCCAAHATHVSVTAAAKAPYGSWADSNARTVIGTRHLRDCVTPLAQSPPDSSRFRIVGDALAAGIAAGPSSTDRRQPEVTMSPL